MFCLRDTQRCETMVSKPSAGTGGRATSPKSKKRATKAAKPKSKGKRVKSEVDQKPAQGDNGNLGKVVGNVVEDEGEVPEIE